MDVGKNVIRKSGHKVEQRLADAVAKRMACWTEDNFVYFEQVMDMIREGAPVQWVKLYMQAVSMGLAKETNINISIDRRQDRENLQALVRARLTPQLTTTGEYTPYEEVKVPIQEKEEL